MKKIISTCLACMVTFILNAQTWEEWTEQRKTQIKYLQEQIGALQVYAGHAKKGMAIVREGLHTIQQIKNGEWNLHDSFFLSLSGVNPLIKNSGSVQEILAMNKFLRERTRILLRDAINSGALTAGEKTKLSQHCDVIIKELSGNTNLLQGVINDGYLQMTDDERLQRIEIIYQDVLGLNQLLQSLQKSLYPIIKNREQEKKEIMISKTINGLQ